jgi:exopolysaccharide biosynthesis polyprenyl glycosylphosphotransferase
MLWRSYNNKFILECLDGLTIVCSFVAGYLFWSFLQTTHPTLFGHPFRVGYFEILIPILSSFIWVMIFNFTTAYSYQRFTSIETEIAKVIKTSALGILAMVALIFIFRIAYVPRSLIVILFVSSSILLIIEKMAMFFAAKYFRRKGEDRKNILIIGTGKRAENLIEVIRRHVGWGLDIFGVVTDEEWEPELSFEGFPVVSDIDGMRNVLHKHIIAEVIITISTMKFDHIRDVISICEEEGVQVRLNSDFFGSLNRRFKVDYIYDIPIISIMQTPEEGFALLIKRIMDVTLSGLLLAVLSPLLVLIALSIKLTSKGPVFYEWHVMGLNKKPFRSWKFRTMIPRADQLKEKLLAQNEMKGPVFKIKNDPRIIPVGKFLRKFSLDELPQLFSVLKGDMSLVGPRPAGPHELKRYENWHRRKLSIKPGITCLWQISGRNQITDFDEWVKLDLEYIDNWSIGLDIKILFKTIGVVFTGKGAS